MAIDAELRQRVRDALADRNAEEKRMFGGISFLVEGRLVVGVRHDGDLLVRVEPRAGERLAAQPGAHQALMGGRSMGPSWIAVHPDALTGDGLGTWLGHALAFHDAAAD